MDEDMDRELMGREEPEVPLAGEHPGLGEPTSEVRRHHCLTQAGRHSHGTLGIPK